ncbi:hypothetical protein ABIC70_001079 [Methylobacterium sp. 1973]
MFFRTESLSPIGWQQEHAARARLERWCFGCGQSACYGFGVSLKDDGVWSCAEADCMAEAETKARERDCPSPPAKPSNAEDNLDLFGRAA